MKEINAHMVRMISIKNFKSIEDLKLDLGRVNLFIGENGCGKSTILEALTFAAAAEANKLDTEFLESRGIRVTVPHLMRSNFTKNTLKDPIEITIHIDGENQEKKYSINNDNETYSNWILNDSSAENLEKDIKNDLSKNVELRAIYEKAIKVGNGKLVEIINEVMEKTNEVILSSMQIRKSLKLAIDFSSLKDFVIYTPQNKELRNLKEEGGLRPLGINGEGLFRLLREIYTKQPEAFADLEDGLKFIGWYDSMDLENEPEPIEDELFIRDKYLPASITQRSTNEGFLYVLFYMALIVSKDTPKIFAIDNIDSALNPKLCSAIMSYLVDLSDKYNKQLFLTTQNPATLDGLNVFDDEQRLFIVSRKRTGQTTAKRFLSENMPKTDNEETLLLSEAMIKGFIGGIPKGF